VVQGTEEELEAIEAEYDKPRRRRGAHPRPPRRARG
jgi:hypothetical protein